MTAILMALMDDQTLVLDLYERMLRIRLAEERIADLVEAGEIGTPCHLYIGQEAIAAGTCAALRTDDTIWGGHRSHGHYLAKGGDLKAMVAEIFGKATGCAAGRGGSMHLVAPEVGLLGTVPLVAATIPMACGAALASKLRGSDAVAVAFFGDGAADEGHFCESLNLAGTYGLGVIFVLENNLYSSHMHVRQHRATEQMWELGPAHGVIGRRIDGNDVVAVHVAVTEAVQRARSGGGPTLLEAMTYRWRGHVGASWDTDVGVRRTDELQDWLGQDPVARAQAMLDEAGIDTTGIAARVRAEVDEAVDFARSSPDPSPEELLEHVL